MIIFFSCVPVEAMDNFLRDNAEFISLLRGVRINVVAPGSGVDAELMSKIKNIDGLNLSMPEWCFSNSVPFHSASDEVRFKCLKNAILDDSSTIIWAIRGGYGSAKLIDELHKLPKPAKRKVIIGYSDITALHLFFTQEWNWLTIHGDMLAELFHREFSVDKERNNFVKIAKIITNKIASAKIKNLEAFNDAAKKTIQVINGKMTGGNLTIVENSIGTNWQIKTQDKIIFLEEVHVKPYQLDRTLLHIKQAGLLKHIKAIIFGNFNDNEKDIIKVLVNFASSLDIPVFKTDRFGHSKVNEPIIYNTDFKIIKSEKTFTLIMNNEKRED